MDSAWKERPRSFLEPGLVRRCRRWNDVASLSVDAMAMPTLVIANKNYSSWSLRPWLLMRAFGVAFEECRLVLDSDGFRARIGELSPSGKVPVLHHDDRVVWDSLAICEYVNETFLEGRGWPTDAALRGLARSAACEMHSGFASLRAQLPMNCARRPDARRWGADAEADITRVLAIWTDLLRRSGGPWLCGEFGIVDAMFAPVVIRFRGFGVELSGAAHAYAGHMLAMPEMREWIAAGVAEPERLEKYETRA